MISNGFFEKIIHFSECCIFRGVNSSIVIFKYVKKSQKTDKPISIVRINSRINIDEEFISNLCIDENAFAEVFEIPQFELDKRWVLANSTVVEEIKKLEDSCGNTTLEKICEIGNGMVSGLDKAFIVKQPKMLNDYEKGLTIDVVKGKDTDAYFYKAITSYCFIPEGELSEEELKDKCPHFFDQFQRFKDELENRYQYGRHIDYWSWVFPRNYKMLSQNVDKIFVPCKERISNKDHFRFVLVEAGIFSTQDVTALYKKTTVKESLEYILAFLNCPQVFMWVKNKGIVKGNIVEFSEAPLNRIPFRLIDWNNPKEVEIHDNITSTVQSMRNSCGGSESMESSVDQINSMLQVLLSMNKHSKKYDQTRL